MLGCTNPSLKFLSVHEKINETTQCQVVTAKYESSALIVFASAIVPQKTLSKKERRGALLHAEKIQRSKTSLCWVRLIHRGGWLADKTTPDDRQLGSLMSNSGLAAAVKRALQKRAKSIEEERATLSFDAQRIVKCV